MWLTLLRYLGPPALLILILLGVYWKGKSVERKAQAYDQMRLVIERLKLDNQVIDAGQKVKRKVEKIRKTPPPQGTDAVYSCLLSNDPLSNKCEDLYSR